MGDEAETIFQQVATENCIGYTEYGLRRPPLDVSALPAQIRYTPDFLTDAWGLVEVQGSGADRIIKLKADKLEALRNWNEIYYTQMFLWNRPARQWNLVGIDQFDPAKADTAGFFDETKPYYGFKVSSFAGWRPL